MTLVILALDGLDAGLIERFSNDGFRLERSADLETFKYMTKDPHTLEVWPTVASGVHPEEHGITGGNTSEWENPIFNLGSKLTSHLHTDVRARIGGFVRDTFDTDYGLPETDVETVFDRDDAVVHNWPGVANSDVLREIWRLTNEEYSREEFEREVFAKTAEQFGWAREMPRHRVSLAAVHVHAPDVFGHHNCYADDEEHLRRLYRRLEEFVVELEAMLEEEDDLLILSDHGIANELLDEENIGGHSFRAFVASTIDEPLPESVFDVREWIEDHAEKVTVEETEMDIPEEQLRRLGYME